ncbi:hypothetical protein DAEQUDRAFT_565290 [Daedalea quercina L-15889]|uniref:Uncharacterized protein n=1 Tax=Daedalea quercina L-15889 TaxID=1314783 RepID=A0A165LXG4_9APHY|nr:hypothetical protein DAEQUDRAFT_565290 [Daedalea quercina L-15889]
MRRRARGRWGTASSSDRARWRGQPCRLLVSWRERAKARLGEAPRCPPPVLYPGSAIFAVSRIYQPADANAGLVTVRGRRRAGRVRKRVISYGPGADCTIEASERDRTRHRSSVAGRPLAAKTGVLKRPPGVLTLRVWTRPWRHTGTSVTAHASPSVSCEYYARKQHGAAWAECTEESAFGRMAAGGMEGRSEGDRGAYCHSAPSPLPSDAIGSRVLPAPRHDRVVGTLSQAPPAHRHPPRQFARASAPVSDTADQQARRTCSSCTLMRAPRWMPASGGWHGS